MTQDTPEPVRRMVDEIVEATRKDVSRLTKLAVDATAQRNPQILGDGIPDNFISDRLRERLTTLVNDAVREERERQEDMMHLVFFLAGVYQKNFEEFSPHHNPNAPEWKKEAYMHLSTVQGSSMRRLLALLAAQEVDQDKLKSAIGSFYNLTPTTDNPTNV